MIIALTPNLSLDRVLTLDKPLTVGSLHRAPSLNVAAGGKGVNLARVVRAFGGEVVVAGFVAGFNGQRFRYLLQEEGLAGVLVPGEGETRECHILLDAQGGHPTEINEMGFAVTDGMWNELLGSLPPGMVAVCGSLPPGCTREQFRGVLRRLNSPVVDGSGVGLEVALDSGARLIKPNEHELKALTGDDSLDSARDLHARTGVSVLLTLGERGAAYIGNEVWQADAPRIDVKNPVGSGDSFLAAFLHAQQAGETVPDALRLAIGAGSANAMLGGPLKFDALVARELAAQVHLEVRS